MADPLTTLKEQAALLEKQAGALAEQAAQLQVTHGQSDPFIFGLTIFVLACFVGYYVVWRVTPALHTPLMSVTNAISSIIIVGAIIAVGSPSGAVSNITGFIAVVLASVNIFGGFLVTQRMLGMYKKKEKKVTT